MNRRRGPRYKGALSLKVFVFGKRLTPKAGGGGLMDAVLSATSM
ncbi:hypothetical protein PRUB_a4635 [Pseudoalteromonas rubra]|uniref:Uncharacterized protein n=1 Tax=Pseudoalteromonas rubra TaxID=43658 RepID=A0A8T0CBV0_9GAMM|nr:hypothetical protein PRUB_a4635 [Pseudoalteromonas rubra]